MEEDNIIKELFSDFKPELSSDRKFMNRLQRNMDSVELVKQHNAEFKSRSMKAVAIAAFIGFTVGLLFSLALPYIGKIILDIKSSLPNGSNFNYLTDNYLTITWIIIGVTSVLTALNAYELSSFLMKRQAT